MQNLSPESAASPGAAVAAADGRPAIQFRKISVPAQRYIALKKAWLRIYIPIHEEMKIDIRMNLKARRVELKTRTDAPDASNSLRKCAGFVRAFMLGFDVADAVAMLRRDDLDVMTFEGEHLPRRRSRNTKSAIENRSRKRIVVAGSTIHVLGSFENIMVACRYVGWQGLYYFYPRLIFQ